MDLTDALLQVLVGLKYYLPAYAANGAPVVFKGKTPIDGGRYFMDGRRILGDGKTWEGLAAGILAGTVTAAILALALGEPYMLTLGFMVSILAMLGDIAGSFVKRRMGLNRGDPAPVLDQLDFFVAATIGLYLAGVNLSWPVVLVLAVVTFMLHRATNYLAFRLGLKNVPW